MIRNKQLSVFRKSIIFLHFHFFWCTLGCLIQGEVLVGEGSGQKFFRKLKYGGVGGVNKRGIRNSFCNIDKIRKFFQDVQANHPYMYVISSTISQYFLTN